jgi:HSP20 family molecular chaperone IbpA
LDYTITQKPLTDIIETHGSLIIRMDLPGVNKEDLKVDIGEYMAYINASFQKKAMLKLSITSKKKETTEPSTNQYRSQIM